MSGISDATNELQKRVHTCEVIIKDSPVSELKNMQKMLRDIATDYMSKSSFMDCKAIFE